MNGRKAPSRQDLIAALRGNELGLQLAQIQFEHYKPAMDAMKLYLDVYGSSSPNLYRTKNKQIAAACQMSGVNDPTATRKQRLAAITCYEMIHEAVIRCLELGLDKKEAKKALNDAIEQAAEFFGLGNKKTVQARNNKSKGKGKGKGKTK